MDYASIPGNNNLICHFSSFLFEIHLSKGLGGNAFLLIGCVRHNVLNIFGVLCPNFQADVCVARNG